jgi:PAS domain S-box-containing protein
MDTLKDLCRFIIKNHLRNFAITTIENLRQSDAECMEMFVFKDDEELLNFSTQNSKDFLESLIENRSTERIINLIQALKKRENPNLNHAHISFRNIDCAYRAQKSALIFFLKEYTKDSETVINILSEIDIYYSNVNSLLIEGLSELFVEKLYEKNKELEDLNRTLEVKVKERTRKLEKLSEELKEKENFLKLITDRVPALIGLIDKKFTYKFVNKNYADWFGLDRERIIGSKVVDIVGEKAFELVKPQLESVLAGNPHRIEQTMPYKYGGDKTVDINLIPFLKNNKVSGFITLILDNTELNKTRELNKANELKFKALADSIPIMVWSRLGDGTLDYCNKRWTEYSGLDLAESKENNISNLHPEEEQVVKEFFSTAIKAGEPYEMEVRFKRQQDEEYRWHLVRSVPFKNEKGEVLHWFGSATDIHEQKLNEQRKDEFLGIAGHELKTPLTSLKAYVELLITKIEDPESKNFVMKTHEQVKRLNKLISDLLDISQINSGTLKINMKEVNWNEVIVGALDTMQSAAPAYEFSFSGEKDFKVSGDKNKLMQVLINLLSNAVKYSPEHKKIEIKSLQENGKLITLINDKGIGISQEDKDKIFSKFYRAQNNNFKSQGFGIGLYVSKEIINYHMGEISVQSSPGKGSSFKIALPLKLN